MGRLGKNHDLTDVAVRKLIGDARFNKVWIRLGSTWYTPDEFEEYALKVKRGAYVSFPEQPTLADPLQALKEARANVERVQQRYEDFLERVIKYYQGNR